MTLEHILPEIRKGRRARRGIGRNLPFIHARDFHSLDVVDMFADDWELEPEEDEEVRPCPKCGTNIVDNPSSYSDDDDSWDCPKCGYVDQE
jgi:predicted RNA-binding Zn-ribbon protein involved in translation (DUF1610 family)